MTAAAAPVVALALVALLLPLPALAASDCTDAASDPTAAQYCTAPEAEGAGETDGVAVAGGGDASGPPAGAETAGASAEAGTLPFTGTDLLALAAVAAAFLAISLALRRLSGAAVAD